MSAAALSKEAGWAAVANAPAQAIDIGGSGGQTGRMATIPFCLCLALLAADEVRGAVEYLESRGAEVRQEQNEYEIRFGDDYQGTSEDVRRLNSIPGLALLQIDCRSFAGEDVGKLRLPNLRLLQLCGPNIKDSALECVVHSPRLRTVLLTETGVTDLGVSKLAGLADLQNMSIVEGGALTNAALASLGQCRSLTRIELTGISKIDDAGVAHLTGLTKAIAVTLNGATLGEAGMKTLGGLATVKLLDLSDCRLRDRDVVNLAGLERLGTLNLRNTEVTDEAVPAIGRLTKLERIDLSNSKVTLEGARRLQQMLPKCTILPFAVLNRLRPPRPDSGL